MKRIYSIALLLIGLSSIAQVPQFINYQGVARTANGIPITGPIAVQVDIHAGSNNGVVVCHEIFHLTTNQFGIFDLRIGSVSPGQFTVIPWGSTKYFVGVAIDPTGGNTFGTEITNQELVSVPYALYAEKAGNAGGSATITSSYPSIISVNSAPPSHTVNYTPPQLMLVQDSILSLVQGAHTSTAVIIKGLSVGPSTLIPGGPWSTSLTNVYLTVGGNNVGIGTSGPAAKLQVNTNTLSTNNAIGAHSEGGNGIYVTTASSASVNAAILANNNGSGYGINATANNPSSPVSGVRGLNSGAGPGVTGENSSGSASSSAHGVYGRTNGSAAFAAGVMAEAYGNGPGAYGYQGSGGASTSAHGVLGVTNSSSAYGVHGMNSSSTGGTGVYGLVTSAASSPNAHGVKGETNSSSPMAGGVTGLNTSAGPGVFGQNTGTGSSANAFGVQGRTSSTNTNVAAVMAENIGTGPAIRGFCGSSSTLALWVENGHMKSTSNLTVSVVTATASAGFTGLSYIKTGCNDVKGIINISTTATGVSNNESFEFNVSFNKSYQTPPTVVISGYGNDNVTYYLKSVFNTYFSVRIINRSGGVLSTAQLANMNVSYYVIE